MRFGTKLRTTTLYHLLCDDCGQEGPNEWDRQGAISGAEDIGWGLDWREEHAYCPEHAKERGMVEEE